MKDTPYYFEAANNLENRFVYVHGYHRTAGELIPLPTDYVAKATSRIYCKGRQVVGGYCLNTIEQGQLRYGVIFTEEEWAFMQLHKQIAEKDILEAAATWMSPELSKRRRLVFFAEMIVHAVDEAKNQGKSYVLVGTIVPKLAPFYYAMLPRSFYDGFCTIKGERLWVSLFVARTEGLLTRALVAVLRRFFLGWLREFYKKMGSEEITPSITSQ